MRGRRALNEPASGMGSWLWGLRLLERRGRRCARSEGQREARSGGTERRRYERKREWFSRARGRTRRVSAARDRRAPCSTRCRPWRRWRRGGCRHRRRGSGRARARRRPQAQRRRESGRGRARDRARRRRRSVRRSPSRRGQASDDASRSGVLTRGFTKSKSASACSLLVCAETCDVCPAIMSDRPLRLPSLEIITTRETGA